MNKNTDYTLSEVRFFKREYGSDYRIGEMSEKTYRDNLRKIGLNPSEIEEEVRKNTP